MQFIPNVRYEICYKDGERLCFTVLSIDTPFHNRRVKIDGADEETLLYRLLSKEWDHINVFDGKSSSDGKSLVK